MFLANMVTTVQFRCLYSTSIIIYGSKLKVKQSAFILTQLVVKTLI